MTLFGRPLAEIGPVVSMALCAGAVPLLVLFRKLPNLREATSLLVAVTNFALVLFLYDAWKRGVPIGTHIATLAPGFQLAFRADAPDDAIGQSRDRRGAYYGAAFGMGCLTGLVLLIAGIAILIIM